MNPLNVFTPDYTFLGPLEPISSYSYTEGYRTCGTFSIYSPVNPRVTQIASIGNVVIFDESRGVAGVIETISQNQDGVEYELTITGRLVQVYLYRRICWGLYEKSGSVVDIIEDLVRSQVIAPNIPERSIPDMSLGVSSGGGGESIRFQSTGGVVGEKVEELCGTRDLGYKVEYRPISKKMTFSVYQGLDRSLLQSTLSPCVFSYEFENLLSSRYLNDHQSHKNVALVAGEGEGLARKTTSVGSGSGKDRFEVFVDARDLSSMNQQGESTPLSEYLKILSQRGLETLSEYPICENFEATINSFGNLVYGEDFFLGDLVTVQDRLLGVQINARVMEVRHEIGSSGESLIITFGYERPTLGRLLRLGV